MRICDLCKGDNYVQECSVDLLGPPGKPRLYDLCRPCVDALGQALRGAMSRLREGEPSRYPPLPEWLFPPDESAPLSAAAPPV